MDTQDQGNSDLAGRLLLLVPVLGVLLMILLIGFPQLIGGGDDGEDEPKKEDTSAVENPPVEGVVKAVTYRPNRAEDGHYSFTVETESGEEVSVNATAFMNTPQMPADFAMACIPAFDGKSKVAQLQEGAAVHFQLPLSGLPGFDYETCWSVKDRKEYFFEVTD